MAVDQKVSGIFDRLFDLAGDARETLLQAGAGATFAELLVGQLPPDSPIPAYLRRLMLAGDDASRALIQRWFESSRVMIDQMGAAGVIRTGDDPATLAAFLMVNDLAMILLRDQIRDVTGSDPLTVEGMSRWFESAVAVYRDGLFLPAEDPANQDPDSPDQTRQDPASPDQRTEER